MKKIFLCIAVVLSLTGLTPTFGQAAQKERTLVKMETSMGNMVIELFPDKAPKSVANFLWYVDSESYNNTIFHRVINGFMIQGGGLTENMRPVVTKAPIVNEAKNGLKNDRYTMAMARTNEPHSATNQFFINVVNNDGLNYNALGGDGWGYAVFGKVVDGMDVVDKIKDVPTSNRAGHQNVPRTPVVIKKAYRFTLP
jgi:cyclophilin family peptidyl-prolyl cis-trans isomerase